MIKKIDRIGKFCYQVKIDLLFFLFMPFYILLFFSKQERKNLVDLKNRKRKLQFISGRIAAKLSVAHLLKEKEKKIHLRNIEIKKEKTGQVYAVYKEERIPVSISHTETVAIALTGRFKKIGIDIERKGRNLKKIYERFVSVEEMEKLEKVPLITIWCVKEALAKALGTGFIYSPKDILICWTDKKNFRVKLQGKFLSNYPQLKDKEIEVQTFEDGKYIISYCILNSF